jgi:hypothetical protein
VFSGLRKEHGMPSLLDVKFDGFVEDFGLRSESEESNWKRFVNYHFFSQFQPGRLDTDADLLDQICVESSEFSQVHGAFFLLNDQILSEPQDVDDILQRDQKGLLELYFLTVGDAVMLGRQLEKLFCDLEKGDKGEKWLELLSYVMSRKIMSLWVDNPVLKIVSYNGIEERAKLKLSRVFPSGDTSNKRSGCEPVCASKPEFSVKFEESFSNIDSISIDKRGLLDIVNSNENSYKAEVVFGEGIFMPASGNEKLGNTYIAWLTAEELVKLMTTSDDLLRRNMFDDNVRDSQGDSAVNQEIMSTLENHPERFVLYNNGITIVCKNIVPKNGKYELENPQIVNGCQTCSVIYRAHRKRVKLGDVKIIAKIVGSNEEVTQGIVRGANRQNIVYEEAFETIKAFHKELEKYFEYKQIKDYKKIYYERRSRQYADNVQIKPQQKIGFRGLIQSMVALFLNHVEDSHKHEFTLLKEYKDSLFVDGHSCQPYYLAAFLYLNIDRLFRERKLPKELKNYKMHVMLLIKELQGGSSPDLSSKDMDKYCGRLVEVFESGKLERYALEACEKFKEIRAKWIDLKGEQYKHGVKDSAEFRDFLMKEIYGVLDRQDLEKSNMGYVMNVKLDRNNNWFGFIEHRPYNIFFHEFDNSDIDRSYIGKKVSYKIIRDGNQERAINVRLAES